MNACVSRRRLLSGSALIIPAIALGACQVSVNGSTTTATLNVAKVVSYFTAGENAVSMLLSIPAIATAIGPTGVAAIGLVEGSLHTALVDFQTAAGSSVSVSLTTSSVAAAFSSGLSSMESLLSTFQKAIADLAGAAVTQSITTTVDAFETVVSLVEALAGTPSPTPASAVITFGAAAPLMTEDRALQILGVRT